jgi:hypothetical protein
MFADGSRYARTPVDTVTTSRGRAVAAIRLRRLPDPPAEPYTVRQDERLDLIAQQRYDDGTTFWHIADANSALEARTLVARVLGTIRVPRS